MRIILFFLFTISSVHCFGQPRDAFYAYNDFMRGAELIPLFDKAEIKVKKISSAFMVRHPMSWKSVDRSKPNPLQSECSCSYNDTFAIYKFDNQGTLREFTYNYTQSQKVSRIYDTSGQELRFNQITDTIQFQQTISSLNIGQDSLVTRIVLEKFSKGLDTAYVIKKRFDKRRLLIEIQSNSNKKYIRELEGGSYHGEYDYHYFQDFDDQGRLNFFSYDKEKMFERISYPDFGRLVETYDVKTNKITSTQITIIQKVGILEPALMISSGREATILTYLDKNSKLFKLRSNIKYSEFPSIEYEEIL